MRAGSKRSSGPTISGSIAGVEPLRELHEAKRARDAHECLYVATGEITNGARKFATEKNVRIVHGAELAKLLPRVGRT